MIACPTHKRTQRECQKKDWQAHKPTCVSYDELIDDDDNWTEWGDRTGTGALYVLYLLPRSEAECFQVNGGYDRSKHMVHSIDAVSGSFIHVSVVLDDSVLLARAQYTLLVNAPITVSARFAPKTLPETHVGAF